MSGTRVESLGGAFCFGCSKLRELLLPPTLREIGAHCCEMSSLELLDLSGTRVESIGSSFCCGCSKLRELLLPPALRTIGAHCCDVSSLKGTDSSGTGMESVTKWFCWGCPGLWQGLLPGALIARDSGAVCRGGLTLLVLPVSSGISMRGADCACVLSGLVGFGAMPARPMWPAK
jgi:hypothetical protein